MDITFRPLELVTLVNLLFTSVFQYVPGLRVKFALLASETKRAIFLGLGVVTAAVWFILTLPSVGLCTPEIGFACEPATFQALLSAVVGLVIGVAGMDNFVQIIPETADVSAAKEAREE